LAGGGGGGGALKMELGKLVGAYPDGGKGGGGACSFCQTYAERLLFQLF
jgi:hypothetical protein